MKIKKEEIKEEDVKTEDIEKEKIKEEDVESSFRASLSHFAYPSSPPSARRPPPKRPHPPDSDSNPNPPSSSASLTVTVAVAQPTPVRQNESNNDESVQPPPPRRSPRNLKRKGETETRTSLDTAGGRGGSTGTRPSKKRAGRRGNPRAPDVDLSHLANLGALPEYLAEDLDGTLLLTPRMHVAFWFLHKMIVCPLLNAPSPYLPSYFLWIPRTVLFCGIKYVNSSHMFSAPIGRLKTP
jgi:hypothetical protein